MAIQPSLLLCSFYVSFLYLFLFVFLSKTCAITLCFLNGPTPAFFRLFLVFSKQQFNFYNKSMWKNVHPVLGAGIQTHNLPNMSRHP